MTLVHFERRRETLRAKLAERGLDALIVSHAANRWYLSGFELHDPQCNESAGWLLVTASGRDRLLTDPRYLDAARRVWPEADVFIYSSHKLATIREFLGGLNLGRIGFEPRSLHVETYLELKETLPLEPAHGLVEELRQIKDAEEIAVMARACALNHDLMRAVPDMMEEGLTEADLAWRIERFFREHGASELAFSSIVGVNGNAALPHAIPGETRLTENCLVLVDVGARLDGYNSDQTRTFWFGPSPSDRFRRTLDMVQEAQAEAMRLVAPGRSMAEAYVAARASFERHGVAAAFTHALGHGIGLETHEPPSLGTQTKGEFRPGMIITVEPGLYYADWGGVRWEYMVLVTEDGCRIL